MKMNGEKSENKVSFEAKKACYEQSRYANYRASLQLEGIVPGNFSPLNEDHIESVKTAIFVKYGISK
jgi:hypothetical protein